MHDLPLKHCKLDLCFSLYINFTGIVVSLASYLGPNAGGKQQCYQLSPQAKEISDWSSQEDSENENNV